MGSLRGAGVTALAGGGENSAMRMAGAYAPPISSEEIPPLHFRLTPKIPLELRSFLLSPPDPLRRAPAGAPFLRAEKEKTLQRALSPLRDAASPLRGKEKKRWGRI